MLSTCDSFIGGDIHVLSQNLPPTTMTYNITGLQLNDYTEYFAVVQGFNHAGIHTAVSSDGFTVDNDPPKLGIVNDGNGNIVFKTLP